jgi:hypothetical protein
MNQKCILPLVFFLGSITSQITFANTSNAPNASPMEALVNSTQMKTETPASTTAAMPATSQPAPSQTLTNESASGSASATPNAAEASNQGAIDCNFTIPEGTSPSSLSPNTVVEWANYAATETFTYDFRNYDKQFKQLQQCYTTAGWESFLGAMKASNNLKVTQEEHLFVTAKVNGKSELISQSAADNTQPTWTIRVPLLVTYQNQDREVTQDMYIDLTIKTNYGVPTHLGVNQIVATPKASSPAA